MEIIEQNKALILSAYSRILAQHDFEYADRVIADNYIQHNPMVKTGKQGYFEFLNMLKQMTKPEKQVKPFMRLFANKKFVVVHLSIPFMGQLKAVVDMYRIENGKIAEHWDAVQDILKSALNDNKVVEGTLEIKDKELTKANESLILKLFKEHLITQNYDRVNSFINEGLIQHDPDIGDGLEAFVENIKTKEITNIHRIIAEGNFVLAQCTAKKQEKAMVAYYIFNIAQGRVIEMWSVCQDIPDKMAHNNGMI